MTSPGNWLSRYSAPVRARLTVTALALAIISAAQLCSVSFGASTGSRLITGQGYSLNLPTSWHYWRQEHGANWIEYFYRDPRIPWSALTIEGDGCSGCLRDPSTGTLNLESALGPIVTATHQLSADKLAFSAIIDPDPLPDNGLVIAIPPVKDGYVRAWWRIDLWLPARDRIVATDILNSVTVKA
jgi:hypothetical protein